MSDPTSLISALIVDRPTCLPCLATRTNMQPEAVETALRVLGRALVIQPDPSRTCAVCGSITTVFLLRIAD